MASQFTTVSIPRDEILRETLGFRNFRQAPEPKDKWELFKKEILDTGMMVGPIVWGTSNEEDETVYVLLDGHRRMRAIDELLDDGSLPDDSYVEIDCQLFEGDLTGAFAVNAKAFAREGLNPADEVDLAENMYNRLQNQEAVAEATGMSQGWVSHRLALAKCLCDRAKEVLRAGGITLKTAKKLASMVTRSGEPDELKQGELLDAIANEQDAADKIKPDRQVKPRTVKNKGDVQELLNKFLAAAEEAIDQDHRASVVTALGWYLGTVTDEDVFAQMPLPDYATEPEPAPKKTRRSAEEIEQARAEAIAAKEAAKQAKQEAKAAKQAVVEAVATPRRRLRATEA